EFNLEEVQSPYPFPLVLEQSQNETILNDKLESYGLRVERRKELVELRQSAESVKASIVNALGANEIIEAKWVVGCDGAHSVVRHRLGLEFSGKSYDQQFVLADVNVDWPLGSEKFCIFSSELGFMAVIPLPHSTLYRLITTENDLSLDH